MWEIMGYCLIGILFLLLALLLVPMHAHGKFDGELFVCVRVWGIPVFRYSSKRETESVPATEKMSPFDEVAEQIKRDGVKTTLSYLKGLSQLTVGATRRALTVLTVDKLRLQLYITGSDAAQTAENTGKACAVLYPTVTALQQTVLRIRKREITVTPDFLGEQGRVLADVTVHAIPIRILSVALWLAVHYHMISKLKKEVSQDGKQSAEFDGTIH